jgi:hypothetical protein
VREAILTICDTKFYKRRLVPIGIRFSRSDLTPSDFPVADVGSRSTPLRDIEGSVHWLRLKQQAARFPDLSFASVFSIRIARGHHTRGALGLDPLDRLDQKP